MITQVLDQLKLVGLDDLLNLPLDVIDSGDRACFEACDKVTVGNRVTITLRDYRGCYECFVKQMDAWTPESSDGREAVLEWHCLKIAIICAEVAELVRGLESAQIELQVGMLTWVLEKYSKVETELFFLHGVKVEEDILKALRAQVSILERLVSAPEFQEAKLKSLEPDLIKRGISLDEDEEVLIGVLSFKTFHLSEEEIEAAELFLALNVGGYVSGESRVQLVIRGPYYLYDYLHDLGWLTMVPVGAPSNPEVVETAVKLWEPRSEGAYKRLGDAVLAAEALI